MIIFELFTIKAYRPRSNSVCTLRSHVSPASFFSPGFYLSLICWNVIVFEKIDLGSTKQSPKINSAGVAKCSPPSSRKRSPANKFGDIHVRFNKEYVLIIVAIATPVNCSESEARYLKFKF